VLRVRDAANAEVGQGVLCLLHVIADGSGLGGLTTIDITDGGRWVSLPGFRMVGLSAEGRPGCLGCLTCV
jgi:hypothetical protein